MPDPAALWTQLGPWSPAAAMALLLLSSLLIVWRLEHLQKGGFEGTVIGTLVTPFCSGLGNLLFVWLVIRDGAGREAVVVNCLVNNATNLTLLLGLPALIWGLSLSAPPGKAARKAAKAQKKKEQQRQLSRLSLLLTLTAGAVFALGSWALGQDQRLDWGDGLMLVLLFAFWQVFHVFEVLKTNVRSNRSLPGLLWLDLVLLGVGAYGLYLSLEHVVAVLAARGEGFFSREHLGWITGWIMVLPNALLAFWYAARRQADVVYSSQIGDGHICIPLCLGLAALGQPLELDGTFQEGLFLLMAALALHALCLLVLKGLPRWAGLLLVAAYGAFLWRGLSAG